VHAKRKAGRPKGSFKELAISEDEIFELARGGVAVEDIAKLAGCDSDTIRARYRKTLERGRAQKRVDLHAWQFKCAREGNPTMLIWLGKQHLGQCDTPPPAVESEGPITMDIGVGADRSAVVCVTKLSLSETRDDITEAEGP
jgi:hypothetical protein